MAFRLFPKVTLVPRRKTAAEIARGSSVGKPLAISQRWTFNRIWIACLPLSIAAVAGSILISSGDPERRPFVIFGIGIALGVIGLASLFIGLIQAGNAERIRRRAREAARTAQAKAAAVSADKPRPEK